MTAFVHHSRTVVWKLAIKYGCAAQQLQRNWILVQLFIEPIRRDHSVSARVYCISSAWRRWYLRWVVIYMKRAVPGSWAGITGSTLLPDIGPAGGRKGDGPENVAEAQWWSCLAPIGSPAFFINARRARLDDGLKAGKWHDTFYLTESNREDKCKRVRMGVTKANRESLSHEPQLQGQTLSQTVEMEQRDRPSTFWTPKIKAERQVDNGSLQKNIDHGALCSGLDVCQVLCFRGKASSFPRHYRVLAEAHLTRQVNKKTAYRLV